MPQLSSDKSITRKAAPDAPGRTANLLNSDTDLFLVYVGMETDLIFTRGIDLPGFASYPLLETEDGRA